MLHPNLPPPRPTASVDGRFALQDGGLTILDRISGLLWQQGLSVNQMNPIDAQSYCKTVALPGEDWRLPTIGERVQLADFQRVTYVPVLTPDPPPQVPLIDPIFAIIPDATLHLWSSTPWPSEANNFYFFSSNGAVMAELTDPNLDKPFVAYARRVR